MIPSILYQIIECFMNYPLLQFGVDWPVGYRVMVKSRWAYRRGRCHGPWHGVEWCLGGVRCCVLCVRQKSVDVEVPKRAIWGGSPQSLLSVSYLHCMVSEYNEGISNSNELERMMQRSAFGGINRYYLLIYWSSGLFKMKKLIWIWIRSLEISRST